MRRRRATDRGKADGPGAGCVGEAEGLVPTGAKGGGSGPGGSPGSPASDPEPPAGSDGPSASADGETTGSERRHGLRALSLRGGFYLMGREGSGIIVRLVGVLLITRAIGPYNYGIYAAAVAFVTLLASVAQLGIDVRLISDSEQPSDRAYNVAFTLLLVASGLAVGIGAGGAFVVTSVSHAPTYVPAFLVLLLSIPLNICWAPAQARIERKFRYRRMAYLELGGDIALYGTSVPLALAGFGYWAPTMGFVVWQGFLFVGSIVAAGVAPRLAWDRDEVRRLLHFGRGYGLTAAIINLGGLVNPLVVGHFVGPAGVGYVALGQRLASTLAFMNRAVGRLALVALGRVQNDLVRLSRGVEETMALQVVALGPLLSGFAVVSSFAVPALFGHKWTPVVDLYPYLAFGDLLMAVFLVPQAVLYAKGRNGAVVAKQALNLLVLAVGALWLVPTLGITGYGIAFVASSIPFIIVYLAASRIVPIRYSRTGPWLLAFSPPMFFALPPWPWRLFLLAPLALIGIVPRMRRDLQLYARMAWTMLRGGHPALLDGGTGDQP